MHRLLDILYYLACIGVVASFYFILTKKKQNIPIKKYVKYLAYSIGAAFVILIIQAIIPDPVSSDSSDSSSKVVNQLNQEKPKK